MTEKQLISDTLEVIRKALEDDPVIKNKNIKENILILNQLVREDGTINLINDVGITKNDTLSLLDNKLDNLLEKHLLKWLDKNISSYLEKYFKNKKF